MRDDRESYQNRMARKEALSRWLAEAAKTRISKEVDEANFQVRTPSTGTQMMFTFNRG